MDARTASFLRKTFQRYYEKNASRLQLPYDFPAREFAAQLWGMKGYVRHVAFQSRSRFEQWVVEKAPRHLYYSSAVYRYPAAQNMDEKGWLGADLIFDIDADHLPACESKVVEVFDEKLGVKASFAPGECVRVAAWEAVKLVDVLVYELGFEKNRIRVEFSGHRGFHVVVDCRGIQECFESSGEVRKEILDYVRGEQLDEIRVLRQIAVEESSGGGKRRRIRIFEVPPRVEDPGIRGRIARIAAKLAARDGVEVVLKAVTASPLDAARVYLRNREKIDEYIAKAVEEARVGVDPQVTLDTKRLVRIPYSLHGKTGLPVIPVGVDRLEAFEVDSRLSPFEGLGEIRVRALVDTPPVEALGEIVKLKAGEVYKLPAPIALYLLCKEVAVLG